MDLALKYRPKVWNEVVGQQAIISILQRQVATKSWKNTYLFAGPHGCGKTTVARILANEINNGEGQPIEIDGASNNGIDNIRNLIIDSQQCSIDCDYKVYIIDEAHQLTRAAWDASLKLIEEPPTSAIFIFCTTNIDKIPNTILSRVQTFQFRRVDKQTIFDRLQYIMNEEFNNIPYEEEALDRIAILADGHVRDAIKLLDKCLSASDSLNLEDVETMLGLIKVNSMVNLNNAIIARDLSTCLNELEKIKSYTSDLDKVYDAFLDFSINCAIYANLKDFNKAPNMIKGILDSIKVDKEVNKILVNRLITLKKYLNSSNAEAFLKTILLEMCS